MLERIGVLAWLALGAVGSVACGDELATGSLTTAPERNPPAGETSTPTPPQDGLPPVTPSPPACAEVSRTIPAAADTALAMDTGPGACNGDLSYGEANGLNLLVAAGAFRFTLEPAETAALLGGRVSSLRLVLASHDACEGCGPDGLPAKAGVLEVRSLRSDWDEGKATGRTGANACRRTSKDNGQAGWGAAAVASDASKIAPNADYAALPAGTIAVADGATSLDALLAPNAVATFLTSRGDPGTSLSFFATSNAQLVVGSKEAPEALRPTLILRYCPQ